MPNRSKPGDSTPTDDVDTPQQGIPLLNGRRHMVHPALRALFVALVLASALFGQRYNIMYTPNSQEGLLLQLIEQLDGAAKVAQMEAFLQRYPTHPSVSWIYEYLQSYHTAQGQIDKALAAGEKLCELNPDDLETAVNNRKLAEKKGDPALMEKWTAHATRAAQKLIGGQKPFYVTQEEWNKRIDYAGSLIAQSDYQLYKQGIDAEKPSERIARFDELITKNPSSFYALQALPHMMRAYRATGNNDKAAQIAEKILAKDPDHDDALLMIAQIYLDRRSNYARVMAVSYRLLELSQVSHKPPTFSDQEWQQRRSFYAGTAYSIQGNAHVLQNNFVQADKSFRAALPYIKGNVQAEASAYFYLGWSNYYLENYKEAAQFFKICLGFPGPFQSRAEKQLDGMRKERRIIE